MKKKKKDDAIVEGWDFDTPLYITMTLFQPKIRNRIKFPIPSHWKPADIQFNDIKTYMSEGFSQLTRDYPTNLQIK